MQPVRRWFLVALTAALAVPGSGAAQSLDRVDELMQEGRIQDAREALLAWADAHPRPGRQDRQRELWLRGVLTLDPGQAEVIYRQLVLEYPGGPFTDQALLRIGTALALRGDLLEAEANFRDLERDYPGSPARLEAVDWLRRNEEALAAARRAAGRAAADAPDTPRTERRPPAGDPSAGAGTGDFAAQLGAFTALDGARILADRVREAGFTPRIVTVEGSDFVRVRVGRFQTADETRSLVARLRAAGFEAGVGTGASRERPAG